MLPEISMLRALEAVEPQASVDTVAGFPKEAVSRGEHYFIMCMYA